MTAGAPALAQGLGSLGSDSGSTTLVDAGPALEAARTSFDRAAGETRERVVGERRLDDELQARLDEIVDESQRRFARAAESRVSELRGDGVLTADELSSALGELRATQQALLREQLNAVLRGAEAPPTRDEARSVGDYIGRLVRYTLVERNDLWRWLVLFGFVAGGLALAWVTARILDALVGRLRRGRRQRTLEELVGALSGPLHLATAVAGVAAGLRYVWIPVGAESFVWLVLRVTFAAAAYWLLWNLGGAATAIGARAAQKARRTVNDQAIDVARKGLRLFLTIVFALFVTEVVFKSDIKGLLAGIGIAGLAISLAAQDTLKNVIASFTIFGDRPFVLGDIVRYRDHFGIVEAVGFRSTRIRRFDGHLVAIPNAELVADQIENIQARPHIRRRFYLDLPYFTPVEKVREAREIVLEILNARDCWPEDFDPKVEFTDFGAYSLRLLVEYRQTPPDYWGAFARDTEINLEILERFRDAGIDIAFPTRRILLSESGEDAVEPTDDEA